MPNYGVSGSYVRSAGLGNASSYQVSGKPFIMAKPESKLIFRSSTPLMSLITVVKLLTQEEQCMPFIWTCIV